MTDPFSLPSEMVGGTALVGLSVWALLESDAPTQWRELRFPRELSVEQVEALLVQVAAGRGAAVFVVEARPGHISFHIGANKTVLAGLSAALAGIAPEVRVEGTGIRSSLVPALGVRAWWPGRWPLLRTETPEMTVAGLLGSLAAVRADEQLQLIVRLTPTRRRPQANIETIKAAGSHAQSLLRRKLAGSLVHAELLLSVTAQPAPRARQLAQGVIATLRTLNGPHGRMRARRLGPARASSAATRLTGQRQRWLLTPKTLLSPAELVPLVGLPIAAPRIAGISYGTSPRLMPPLDLPSRADKATRVFALSTWPGATDRRLAQPVAGGLQHTAVIGPTGSGKSALITRLVEQDMAAGRGALVVDVKGDLVDDLLARVPEHRRRDIIVCDPAAAGSQPGLNLFPAGGDHELTADLLLGTLAEIYRDSWGIRTSSYLRLGLATLAQVRGASLPLLPALFTDRGFRMRVLRGMNDRLLLASWQRFEALSSADQATQLAPALRKLEELTGRARLRVILGQAQPRLHFGEVLARSRIVLVRLPPGLLGAPATRLVSGLVLWQFAQAVEARAALAPDKRPPFMAIAALGALPLPLDSLLERARGHGVGVTLAPQSLGQLSPSLRAALLANVGSLVAFRPSADEARVLARELAGVSPEQLQHLERFEVAMRLSLGPGHVTPTMTGRTLAVGPPCSDPTALRAASAERWGTALEEVDDALAERLGLSATRSAADEVGDQPDADTDAPVGSRRRAS